MVKMTKSERTEYVTARRNAAEADTMVERNYWNGVAHAVRELAFQHTMEEHKINATEMTTGSFGYDEFKY